MTGRPVRVLVVDDHALFREGLTTILDADPRTTVVGEAADGRAAVAAARELGPDVVLMDIRMPGTDGIEATRLLHRQLPAVRVLVLTTFDTDEYVYEAMVAGASGFLLKDADPADVRDAVRQVAAGDLALAPVVTRRLVEQLVAGPAPLGREDVLADLTDREREVLTRIARGQTNTEIAAGLFLSEATVKTYVGRVFAKLGLRDRVQAVVLAYETGLVRPGSD